MEKESYTWLKFLADKKRFVGGDIQIMEADGLTPDAPSTLYRGPIKSVDHDSDGNVTIETAWRAKKVGPGDNGKGTWEFFPDAEPYLFQMDRFGLSMQNDGSVIVSVTGIGGTAIYPNHGDNLDPKLVKGLDPKFLSVA